MNGKFIEKVAKVKIVVAIASHINHKEQIDSLKTAIDSLLDQSNKCDIVISVSFSNDTFQDQFEQIKMNKMSERIKIMISKQQKFQMEHYRILAPLVDDYDLILFCDDDDTYTKDRVFEFAKAYDFGCEALKQNQKLAGVVERSTFGLEYWCYGVVPDIFNTFFERMKDDFDLLKHKYGDFVLLEYFKRLDESKVWCHFKPVSPLYKYTINNPNSVCGSRMNVFADEEKYLENAIQMNAYLMAARLGKCPAIRYAIPCVPLQHIEDKFPQYEYAKVVFMSLYDDAERSCGCGETSHEKKKKTALLQLQEIELTLKGTKNRRTLQTAINEISALPN